MWWRIGEEVKDLYSSEVDVAELLGWVSGDKPV